MSNRIYLKELPAYQNPAEPYPKSVSKKPYYDLEQILSVTMREELTAFIHYRSTQVGIARVYSDRQNFNKLCRFLQTYGRRTKSLRDKKPETWIRQFKGWMLQEGIPLMEHGVQAYGSDYTFKARAISYLEKVLEFLEPEDTRPEKEKDV